MMWVRTFVGRHGGGRKAGKLSEELFYEESGRGEPLCSVTPLKLFAFCCTSLICKREMQIG